MPPFIPIVGGILLLAYLFGKGGSTRKSAVSVDTPLPSDPLKKPIVVTSPPSPGVPPDVQKEVDKLLRKPTVKPASKPASKSSSIPNQTPSREPGDTTKYQDWVVPNDAGRLATSNVSPRKTPGVSPPPPEVLEMVPGGATIKKAVDGVVTTYKVENTPDGAKVEKVKDLVVPMEGQPPINLLRHELVPRPTAKALKLTKVTNSKLASDYAKQAFHAIVDFVEKDPSKPAEVAAFAAEQYFNAVNLAANPSMYSKAMDAIRKGNALSDKAVKERKSA